MGGLRARARAGLLALAAVTAACGATATRPTGPSGRAPTTVSGAPSTTAHVPEPAGPVPSVSARMICTHEVQVEIAYALGETPIAPVRPTWVNHIYSCTYRYGNGAIVMSVKELSSKADTDAYYASYASSLGDVTPIKGLGQGAFVTGNGSVVVRKDWKVLLVDVSSLPAEFGSPPTSAGDVAITVADVVMSCWNGA